MRERERENSSTLAISEIESYTIFRSAKDGCM